MWAPQMVVGWCHPCCPMTQWWIQGLAKCSMCHGAFLSRHSALKAIPHDICIFQYSSLQPLLFVPSFGGRHYWRRWTNHILCLRIWRAQPCHFLSRLCICLSLTSGSHSFEWAILHAIPTDIILLLGGHGLQCSYLGLLELDFHQSWQPWLHVLLLQHFLG